MAVAVVLGVGLAVIAGSLLWSRTGDRQSDPDAPTIAISLTVATLVLSVPALLIASMIQESVDARETIESRYGLSEKNFPSGYPENGDEFLLRVGDKTVECRATGADATTILCPKQTVRAEYTELNRRNR